MDKNNLDAEHILIKKSDLTAYQKKLNTIFPASDDPKKTRILKENFIIVLRELFEDPEDKERSRQPLKS